jgi:hypothetical protein
MSVRGVRFAPLAAVLAALLGGAGLVVPPAIASPSGGPPASRGHPVRRACWREAPAPRP